MGISLGWLLGFVQYAAVAGAEQCTTQLVYSLQSAILTQYEWPHVKGDNYYMADFILNIMGLLYHATGSFLFCSALWPQFLGPLFTSTPIDFSIPTQIFTYSTYGLPAASSLKAYLVEEAGDSILFGLYLGQVLGMAYIYLA